MSVVILAIESSCDDTSAAVIKDGILLSNIIASQAVHEKYGGVVPELASRNHQQNIVPVVDAALKDAGVEASDVSAVAFTRGPGLMGSLLVGISFAKGFAIANNIPMIEVNHLQAHVLANFIQEPEDDGSVPGFPFLCLLVSGGHTQIIVAEDYLKMNIIGQTIDDAAGEAFDKCAKVLGLPYPGGPVVDRYASEGDPKAIKFSKPSIKDLDYSFSGLKTSFLYTLRDMKKEDETFVEDNLPNICASLQSTIIEILEDKLVKAIDQTGIKTVVIGGGVAANSGLRNRIEELGKEKELVVSLPKRKFTTDNAAMVGMVGYYKYLNKDYSDIDIKPLARYAIKS